MTYVYKIKTNGKFYIHKHYIRNKNVLYLLWLWLNKVGVKGGV